MLADAIVVFRPDVATEIGFHLRRAGAVWSKMRFASAQVLAYVEDGLWLRLAAQANHAAARIAARIQPLAGVRFSAPVDANVLFVEMEPQALTALQEHGILFQRRGPGLARFVCRWDTSAAEADALVAAITRASAMREHPLPGHLELNAQHRA